jgi:predicted nucleic acid-binding protein
VSDPVKDRLVFDCNVYLQYLINRDGAGGRCVRLGLDGIENVPDVYRHPIDEDDSCYVNLAIAAGAKLIVSNDRHC